MNRFILPGVSCVGFASKVGFAVGSGQYRER